MNRIRPAAVAGSFYPSDPARLRSMIDEMIAAVPPTSASANDTIPAALIVPHAGYVYSGPVAATAYAVLTPWRDAIRRVVVIGPAHRVPVRGLALSSADGFATPLGVVPVDQSANRLLAGLPGAHVDDRAHAPEHSLEVQVPFLQATLGDRWSLVPIIAGNAPAEMVAEALAVFWGEPDTLVVVSSDLSHYHHALTARRLDAATAAAIVAADWEMLSSDDACGVVPVRGALELTRRYGEHVALLDLRNSGDTAGPSDRVVGYGSFLVR
ncbi:MAG: AmmeMemoRadiSam system protein B [Ilumatobacteraceae bacterium]